MTQKYFRVDSPELKTLAKVKNLNYDVENFSAQMQEIWDAQELVIERLETQIAIERVKSAELKAEIFQLKESLPAALEKYSRELNVRLDNQKCVQRNKQIAWDKREMEILGHWEDLRQNAPENPASCPLCRRKGVKTDICAFHRIIGRLVSERDEAKASANRKEFEGEGLRGHVAELAEKYAQSQQNNQKMTDQTRKITELKASLEFCEQELASTKEGHKIAKEKLEVSRRSFSGEDTKN